MRLSGRGTDCLELGAPRAPSSLLRGTEARERSPWYVAVELRRPNGMEGTAGSTRVFFRTWAGEAGRARFNAGGGGGTRSGRGTQERVSTGTRPGPCGVLPEGRAYCGSREGFPKEPDLGPPTNPSPDLSWGGRERRTTSRSRSGSGRRLRSSWRGRRRSNPEGDPAVASRS